jgi:hypothetical protein
MNNDEGVSPEFIEKWAEYLELRRKMNASTSKREADAYFEKCRQLLDEFEK